MADHSFLPYREPGGPVAPEDRDGPFDPRQRRRRWLREGMPRTDRGYVLYWMQMYRRTRSNAALDEAIRLADRIGLPVVVYEGLGVRYPGACDRHHRFLLGCARETARDLADRGIRYVFGLRRSSDDGRATAAEMMEGAAAVVVDDYPAFVLPDVTRAALERTADGGVPALAVDDNGVVPLGEMEKRHYAARTIRPVLHRLLPSYLHPLEEREPETIDPDVEVPAEGVEEELGEASDADLVDLVASCDVDHGVPPSTRYPPGRDAAGRRLERFLEERIGRYADDSSDPGADARSELSPYLHFGCVSSREVALRTLEALPDWARETMAEHAGDDRPWLYDHETFERAETHDELWNAAQEELLHTGTIHGYVRMLWGKKILEWSPDYRTALDTMVRLHDRAFGERPVFGKLRPMTSESTRRKHDVDSYLQRVESWSADGA